MKKYNVNQIVSFKTQIKRRATEHKFIASNSNKDNSKFSKLKGMWYDFWYAGTSSERLSPGIYFNYYSILRKKFTQLPMGYEIVNNIIYELPSINIWFSNGEIGTLYFMTDERLKEFAQKIENHETDDWIKLNS